jgi:DNA-binding NarL/FixJ family response regulator
MLKTKIFVVEDHHIFRFGLCELISLEEDLEVCGEADAVDNAWNQIQSLKPDMVIVDISLKDGNGLDLVERIHDFDYRLPVLVLSMHDEALYAERSLKVGARGYIMKEETAGLVIKAIYSVLNDKIYVSESVMSNMLSTMLGKQNNPTRFPVETLTNRELEVFSYIGQGLTTKQIAGRLHLGAKTIGTYRERIKEKLKLKNANELIKHAVYWVANR